MGSCLVTTALLFVVLMYVRGMVSLMFLHCSVAIINEELFITNPTAKQQEVG